MVRPTLYADDEGVTPVLGVLLAVAITVTLGGVVFAVATQFGRAPQDNAPSMQFLIENKNGQIQIVRAENGIDISTIEVKLSVPGHFAYASPAGLGTTTLPADTWVQLSTTPGTKVTGGDAINFCANTGGGGILVGLRHHPANDLLYQNSFTTLGTCT